MTLKSGQLPSAMEAVLDDQLGQLRDELLTIVKYASKFTSSMATKEAQQGAPKAAKKSYMVRRHNTEPGGDKFEATLDKATSHPGHQLAEAEEKRARMKAQRQESDQMMHEAFQAAQGKIRGLMNTPSGQLKEARDLPLGSPHGKEEHLSQAIKEGSLLLGAAAAENDRRFPSDAVDHKNA